jgi:hypothetical protein
LNSANDVLPRDSQSGRANLAGGAECCSHLSSRSGAASARLAGPSPSGEECPGCGRLEGPGPCRHRGWGCAVALLQVLPRPARPDERQMDSSSRGGEAQETIPQTSLGACRSSLGAPSPNLTCKDPHRGGISRQRSVQRAAVSQPARSPSVRRLSNILLRLMADPKRQPPLGALG